MVRDDPLDWPDPQKAETAAEQALDRPVTSASTIEEGVNAAYRLELGDGTPAVLKAATLATNEAFRPEPHVTLLVGRNTEIPAPEVLAAVGPDESPLGVAFFVSEYCEGRHVTDVLELSAGAHERLIREAGQYLAQLHDLPVADGFGHLRVEDGDLTVSDGHDSWPEWFGELTNDALAGLGGEGYLMDDDPRFADLEPTVREALDAFPPNDAASRDIDPAVLHGDPRPANLVFAPDDDADPLVRAVLDFGGQTGDGLLDLARAEDALIDLPLGQSERADRLRQVLRESYRDRRSVQAGDLLDASFGEPFPPRYSYYRLYARVKALAGFDFWSQFAREDEEKAIARRWRSFVRERLAEVEVE